MAQPAFAAPRRTSWPAVLAGVGALAALLAVGLLVKPKPAKAVRNLTVPVHAAPAARRDAEIALTELGSAAAWRSVTVKPQIAGRLARVDVAEGAYVGQGARLAEIDDAPFRAALMQAQGALRRDEAMLEQARLDLARYRTLAEQNSIARQQVEAQAALVKQHEGTVLLDQGAVKSAEVNLGYCVIRAPVAGRVGVRLVDPGNLVAPTDAGGIVTVNQIQPIAVTFSVPEADFQRLLVLSRDFTRPLAVTALSQESGRPLGQGVLAIADNHVDPATGTVQLKARFENVDKALWPNLFVNVRLVLDVVRGALVVPTAAINQSPRGAFVYVVDAGHRAQMRPVRVLAAEGGDTVLAGGVEPGERVVTDGQMLLRPGAQVAIADGARG